MLTNIIRNWNTNKQMKTLLIWAPIAVKTVLLFSPVGSNNSRRTVLKHLPPTRRSDLHPQRASRPPELLCLPATNTKAGSWTEESGVEGSEVIFWPLRPPWSSKTSAPCRQTRLHSSRGPPLETHEHMNLNIAASITLIQMNGNRLVVWKQSTAWKNQ